MRYPWSPSVSNGIISLSDVSTQIVRLSAQMDTVIRDGQDSREHQAAFEAKTLQTLEAVRREALAAVEALEKRLEDDRKGKSTSLVSLMGIGLGALAMAGTALFTVVSSKIDNQISPVASQTAILGRDIAALSDRLGDFGTTVAARTQAVNDALASLREGISTSVERDSRSESDRANLHATAEVMRDQVGDLSSRLAGLTSGATQRFTEVETQLRAVENLWGEQRSSQERTNAILWEKVLGARYPDRAGWHPSIVSAPPPLNGK